MPNRLHPAALLLLLGAAPSHAQIHSPQVTIHRQHVDDLSWLLHYTQPAPDGDENALAQDPRLKALLRQNLTAPQSFWGNNRPLDQAAFNFLSGPPGRAFLEGNRYFNADACVAHFCPNRGLLWIDTALARPLVVFSAIDWIADNRATDDKSAAYTLWLFSNQPLDSTRIPGALIRSIRRWTAQPASGSTDLQNITRVFLVDPDGTPHQLTPSDIGAHNALPPETRTQSTTPFATETKVNP